MSHSHTRWAVLAVVLFAEVLDLLDATITNIAAPTIAKDLYGGAALIQWLGAGYALSLGVLLVVGGRLGDKYGRRRLFLIGVTGFTLASVACGLAFNPSSIIIARLLQGAFGALLIPQGFGILASVFPRDQLGKAFAFFGPVLGLSAVCGPILAGFLIDLDLFGLGWRAMFLINIVLGGLTVALGARLIPSDTGSRDTSIDGAGAGLLAAAMLGLLYGLISSPGWILFGLVAFALFCRRQATAANPLIEPSLLRNRGFTSGLLLGIVFFAAVSGLLYVLSLFVQNSLDASPLQAALYLAPVAAGIVVASIASHQLIDRLGRRLVLIGLALTLLGTVVLLALVATPSLAGWMLILPVFVTGLGLGTCFGTIYNVTIGDIDPKESGSASGSLAAVQQLANSIGAAAITMVYFASTGHDTVTSLVVVAVAVAACLPVVALMPHRAAAHAH